jgi:hypothetical protein
LIAGVVSCNLPNTNGVVTTDALRGDLGARRCGVCHPDGVEVHSAEFCDPDCREHKKRQYNRHLNQSGACFFANSTVNNATEG